MKKRLFAIMMAFIIMGSFVVNVSAGSDAVIISRTEYLTSGESAMITGYQLENVTGIQFCRLSDNANLEKSPQYVRQPRLDEYHNENESGVISPNFSNGVKGEILNNSGTSIYVCPPKMEFGVWAAKIITNGAEGELFYFNSPIVEWTLGNMGTNKATAGSELRVQGKNLWFGEKASTVKLVNEDGSRTYLCNIKKQYDKYSIAIELPTDIPNGSYRIFVYNGYGDDTCWSEPGTVEVVDGLNWPKTVFNVKDYGAKGDMAADDTAAFRLAFAAASDNGGGVVYVPKGTYVVTGGFTIPKNTEFTGENNMVSQIIFDTAQYDTGEVPEVMINATDNFAVRNLYIWGTRLKTLIKNTERDKWDFLDYNNIFFENNIIRSHAWMGKVDINNHYYDAQREVTPEGDTFASASLILLEGNNLRFDNNSIYTYSGIGAIQAGSGLYMSENEFLAGGTNGVGLPIQGHQNCIVEDNSLQNGQISYGAWNRRLNNDNIYHARNTQHANFSNDRETMTMDGQKNVYHGTNVSVSGNEITFPKKLAYSDGGMKAFVGCMVHIVTGKGQGQARSVVAYNEETNTATLSTPFKVNPDNNSVINFVSKYNNFVITENDFNESNCLATYAMGHNWTIDGNSFTRTRGIELKAYSVYSAVGNVDHYDILGNHFNCATNYIHWTGSLEKGYLSGSEAFTIKNNNNVRYINFRSNKIDEGGRIYIQNNYASARNDNMLIQNNTITNTDEGIVFNNADSANSSDVMLYHNKYNNVAKVYNFKNAEFGKNIVNMD